LRVPSSGVTSVPITITAGPGHCGATPPLIDGAVTIPAHQWVQHSGSIYKAKVPIDLIANPSPTTTIAGWTRWSSTGDAALSIDNACPGQTGPCMLFTSGAGNSIAISNAFALGGGVDYSASVQLRAPLGARIKLVVRRNGPTFESLAPDQWITANGEWQTISNNFRAATSLASARLDVEAPGGRVRVNMREAHVVRLLPGAAIVSGVFVDSLAVRRAHHPNFGQAGNPDSLYAPIASAGGKTTLDAANLSLPVGATLTPGLGVAIKTVEFAVEERSVAAINGRILTLSAPTGYNTLPGFGFYLTGALWMLDSPGEWFFDTATAMLYLWMPDGAAPGNRVSAGGLALGANLAARSNLVLRDIAFRRVTTGAALTGSTATTIRGVAISDAADYGVSAENCNGCAVLNSTIARTGSDAVRVPGALSRSFSLLDSTIADAGASVRTDGWRMLPRFGSGAVYAIGPATTIARNSITATGNLGLYIGSGSVIADNYLGQICLQKNDCGAIYANFLGNGSSITGNVIENVVGNLSGLPGTPQARTIGIYLDDRNAGSQVSGNTVAGAEYGIQLHNASGATVTNNLLYGNRRQQIWFHENTAVVRGVGDIFGNTVSGNTLVPTASGPAVNLFSELGTTSDFSAFNTNHYSALLSPRVISEVSPTSSASFTVAEWGAAGREAGARVTQPVGYVSFLAGATNLVPNGALANSLTGWTWWNQASPLASVATRTCSFGPCLDLVAGASTTLLSSPNFSVVVGQWYRVAFDAVTGQAGQAINVVVRRGGGGSTGYEYLMPAAESFAGSTAWRRYSFAFQATKTVVAGDPATQELGARVDFQGNLPGAALSVARLEMVTLTPAQAALQIRLLLNRGNTATSIGCVATGVPDAVCNSFVYLDDASPVLWPANVGPLSGRPIYTRDTTLTDGDSDGIADQQDFCPGTVAGQAVNARGCAFAQ